MTSRILSFLSFAIGCFGALPASAQTALENPLGDITNPDEVIANLIKVFLGVVGAIALLIFIYGGFTILISGGNPEKVKKGRDALFWATMGLIIIFGSYGLTQFIFEAFGLA